MAGGAVEATMAGRRAERRRAGREEVMVLDSDQEGEAEVLSEAAFSNILENVTVTRTPARKRKQEEELVLLSDSDSPPAAAARKASEADDPLDMDTAEKEVEQELDKLDELKIQLAKSSVNITYQRSGVEATTKPSTRKSGQLTPKRLEEFKRTLKTRLMPEEQTPKTNLKVKLVPRESPVLRKPLLVVRPSPKSIKKLSKKPLSKPMSPKPKPVEKPKPAPRVPKIIDRGPVDCFDSLIVETDLGFPCNYCEVEQRFTLRREMIGHMQSEHEEELTMEEQRAPSLAGRFPCSECGTLLHTRFTQRTHERAHARAEAGPCDNYYRYYLAFGEIKSR